LSKYAFSPIDADIVYSTGLYDSPESTTDWVELNIVVVLYNKLVYAFVLLGNESTIL